MYEEKSALPEKVCMSPSLCLVSSADSTHCAQIARVVFAQLLQALQHVHEHGYVHRDLSMDNILLTRSGEVRLADFGLATSLQENAHEASPVRPRYSEPNLRPPAVPHSRDRVQYSTVRCFQAYLMDLYVWLENKGCEHRSAPKLGLLLSACLVVLRCMLTCSYHGQPEPSQLFDLNSVARRLQFDWRRGCLCLRALFSP